MKIAVDAKWYHSGPAGVRTYTHNLLNTLHDVDQANEYEVYLRAGEPTPPNFTSPHWNFHPLSPSLSAPRVWWALPKAAKRHSVDLFFTQSLVPSTKRAPRVMTVHDVLWHDFPEHFTLSERLHFHLIDRAILKADLIITDSEHSRERICATSGRKESDVVVIPLGVDSRFAPLHDEATKADLRQRHNLPKEFVLYVGRLNRRKNLPTLFKAMAKLSQPWPLVCIGARDWKQDDLAQSLRESGMEDRVQFLGRVDDADLPGFYSLATVFAYIPFAEGFGIPPLEAMACGTPVIASNATSVPEVIGDAGVLVSPGSVDEVADALEALMTSPNRRNELIAAGTVRAAAFTWRSTAQKVLDVWGRFG